MNKTNDAPSYQNSHPKIVVSNRSSNRSRSHTAVEQKATARKRSDSYEFELHQLYHNAVECLIKCDRTICSLREKLSLKDETITSLEEKIVQMSLELASSMAMQDEQSHQLYRLKRRISSLDGEEEDCNPAARPRSKSMQVSSPSANMLVDYSPVSFAKNDREGPHDPRPNPKDISLAQTPSIPTASESDNSKRRRGFRMPSFRANRNTDIANLLGGSHKSETSVMFTDVSIDLGEGSNTPSNYNNNEGFVRQSVSDTTIMAAQTKSPFKGHRRHCSWKDSIDDSATRRLSNIGHFLLGLNRNENAKDETNGEKVNSERQEEEVQPRRESLQVSIEGVVFPVSSQEILAVCWDEDQTATFDESARRVSSYGNEEWPVFR